MSDTINPVGTTFVLTDDQLPSRLATSPAAERVANPLDHETALRGLMQVDSRSEPPEPADD